MKPKKEEVAQRIIYIKETLGLSLSKLAEIVGVPKGTFNSYTRGLAIPPENVVEKLSEISYHTKDWIYYGELIDYIKELICEAGYEKFISDFPSTLHDLHEYLSTDFSNEYPNGVYVLAIFKKDFYYPKMEKYIENLLGDYIHQVDKHPIKEFDKVLGSENYLKKVWMSLGTNYIYSGDDIIQKVGKKEFEIWMELYRHFDKSNEEKYEEFLNYLVEYLSDNDKTREVIEVISNNLLGMRLSSEELVEVFKNLKPEIETLKDNLNS